MRQLSKKGGILKVLLLAPNDYRVMTPNLGVATIYKALNPFNDILIDRGYLSHQFLPGVMRRSLENNLDFYHFDLIALSVSFELDYLNFLLLLYKSGIPIHRKSRNEKHPFIIAGGKAVSCNPFPLSEFIDLALLGDAEVELVSFVRYYKENFKVEKRAEIRRFFAKKTGYFVPEIHSKHSKIKPLFFNDIQSKPAFSFVTSPLIEFPDKFLLEVQRGCPYNCSFCLIGSTAEVFNFVTAQSVSLLLEKHVIPVKKGVGLVGSAVLNHPEIDAIIEYLDMHNIPFSISSLRAEKVSDYFLEKLVKTGQKTITLAPETASDGLKTRIRKATSNEVFFSIISRAAALGIKNFKFYFIVGLPGEGDEDLLAIAGFARDALLATGNKIRLTFSINFFIPKPGTPFAKEFLVTSERAKRIKRELLRELKSFSNLKVDLQSHKMASFQNLFATGGTDFSTFLGEIEDYNILPGQFLELSRNYFENQYINDRII
ncbi:B12-binding domain-containing radical SAM protein [Candidatus Riflebacteria bacterium]